MANINSKVRFPVRLQAAVEDWAKYTEPMRKARKAMLSHYANGWYENKATFSQPLNLIDRGVQIIAPFLVSNNPKVMVDAKVGLAARRPFARTLELALEHLLKEIKLAQLTLRPAVINSLFSMGITRTGICASEVEVEVGGHWHNLYQPYCDNIDFEDYIGDVSARRREEMDFEGNKYRVSLEFVRESGLFKNHDYLKPDRKLYGEDTSPESISKQDSAGYEYRDLHPKVELIDIWLPKENTIITIPPRGQGRKIMRTVEYVGPEGGPYDILGYKQFPDAMIPIPPVWGWLDLNNVINRIVKKMRDQAEREKKLILYDLGASEDAINIKNANDGDTVGVTNVESVKEITYGGPNEIAFPFIQYLEQQYSITGGNLYTLGGRNIQAETLGQEQMLQANASKQLEDMVEQVHYFTKRIIEKLAWHLWSDPLIQIPVIKRVGDVEVEVTYSKEVQEGDFLDYNFDIEPYSMQKMNPEMRYQRLMQMIAQIVLPTAQIAASQGSVLNVNELVREVGRFLDVRNSDTWWQTAVPQQNDMGPYQPMQGTAKPSSGQQDGRFNQQSGPDASNFNNLNQQQTNRPMESSAPKTPQAAGV